MKVKTLIEQLKMYDFDDEVIMSSDSEGNRFSSVEMFSTCKWDAASGEIGIRKLTDELREKGYAEEDVGSGVDAICLWPA